MSSFLGGLGNFLTPATQMAGAVQGAQAQGNQEQIKQAIQQAALQRQEHEDAIKEALTLAQTKNTLRQAGAPVEGSSEWLAMKRAAAGAETEGATPGLVARADAMAPITVKTAVDTARGVEPIHTQGAINTAAGVEPIHTQGAVNTARAIAPIKVQEAIDTARGTADFAAPIAVTGADGKPTFVTRSQALGMNKPDAGGKGGMSGSAQNMQARLLAAVSEGRLADKRIDDFVSKHTKDGKLDVSSLDQIQANAATNLASSHSLKDIVAQGLAEGHMNNTNPEYMQMMRDARLISRAEQLMSARGGSEAMANDNAFLARGGANAPLATLEAASKTRKAMFGKMGAVAQTLSPDQAAKLQAGLDALMKDDEHFDYAGVGKEIASAAAQHAGQSAQPAPAAAPHTALPPLSRDDQTKAAINPQFKAWLTSKGYAF